MIVGGVDVGNGVLVGGRGVGGGGVLLAVGLGPGVLDGMGVRDAVAVGGNTFVGVISASGG